MGNHDQDFYLDIPSMNLTTKVITNESDINEVSDQNSITPKS